MAGNAILDNYYNYYQMNYMPNQLRPTSSRFDAHKKSDLKKIYNSIVKLDKEAPVFLLDRSSAVEKYSIQMKESALRFRNDVAGLGGLDEENMFEQKSVFSSDTSIADATYINSEIPRDTVDPATLSVDQIAKQQINHGTYLPMNFATMSEGNYSFDVSTNVSNYELQFSVGPTDNNHSIQTRLARLINNANIGLNASVSYGENDSSALVISSTSTGSYNGDQPFEISDEDTSQKKGIVDHLGIRYPTQKASWAEYSVDGQEFESPTNKIEVNNTYSVELKKAAPGQSITLDVKPDYESFRENIHGLAGAYNNFIRSASEYLEKQPRTTLLISSMKRMTSLYQDGMNSLGINQNEDGTLSVDDEKLSDGLQTDIDSSLQSLKDFTKSALHKVNQVQLNPMDYVDKRIVAYKDPSKTHYANPYITSAYSGMMFNAYM